MVNTGISLINYKVYGSYVRVDESGTPFAKAIETIYSVPPKKDIKYVCKNLNLNLKKEKSELNINYKTKKISGLFSSTIQNWNYIVNLIFISITQTDFHRK